jgi:hypothetical protein
VRDERLNWNGDVHSGGWTNAMINELRRFMQLIREALGRLAASPEEQRAYLVNLGTAPGADELALELDDAVQVLPQLVDLTWLTQEQTALIMAVHRKLGEMSGAEHAALWVISVLDTSPDWADVRALARAALDAFPYDSPARNDETS